jgi:hypothetical protein
MNQTKGESAESSPKLMRVEVNKSEAPSGAAKSSRGAKAGEFIDLNEANKITRKQSQWIKKHTFKIAF